MLMILSLVQELGNTMMEMFMYMKHSMAKHMGKELTIGVMVEYTILSTAMAIGLQKSK